jgi:hypothetical protein
VEIPETKIKIVADKPDVICDACSLNNQKECFGLQKKTSFLNDNYYLEIYGLKKGHVYKASEIVPLIKKEIAKRSFYLKRMNF